MENDGINFQAKNITTLLRGITFKHHGNFYCLNCLHSFRIDKK